MLNKSTFNGRLTRDIELKYTKKTQKPVAQFTIAVQRNYPDDQGNYNADFVRFLIWGKKAENLVRFTQKGSLVGIESHTQSSNYMKDGEKIYRTDNVVDLANVLESKKNTQNDSNVDQTNSNDYRKNGQTNSDVDSNSHGDPFADNSTPIDISDDDLPF